LTGWWPPDRGRDRKEGSSADPEAGSPRDGLEFEQPAQYPLLIQNCARRSVLAIHVWLRALKQLVQQGGSLDRSPDLSNLKSRDAQQRPVGRCSYVSAVCPGTVSCCRSTRTGSGGTVSFSL
jgi:hypothetical protein